MTAPTRRFRGAKQASLPMDIGTAMIYCHGLMSDSASVLALEQLWVFIIGIDEEMFKHVYTHKGMHDTFVSMQAQLPLSRARLLSIARALDTGCLSFNDFYHEWRQNGNFDFFTTGMEDYVKEYFANHMLASFHPILVEEILDRGGITTQHLSRCANWPAFFEKAVEGNPERWLIYSDD